MGEPNTVEVIAAVDYRDLQQATFQIARAATKWKRSLIISIAISAALFPAISLAYRDGSNLFWMTVVGIGFGVLLWVVITPVMLVFAYGLSFLTARTLLRSNPNFQGPCTYRFSENGYSFLGLHSNGEVLWAALLKVQETRESFLLYPQINLAYVIPKHCFARQTDIGDLKRMLHIYYKGDLTLLG